MQEAIVSTIDEEFKELQKSRVKAHVSKTKTGKLTRVKEYSRAGQRKGKLGLSNRELVSQERERMKIKKEMETVPSLGKYGKKWDSMVHEERVSLLKDWYSGPIDEAEFDQYAKKSSEELRDFDVDGLAGSVNAWKGIKVAFRDQDYG